MTIALSVGQEHFQSDAEIVFDFNPNWLLFNSRATRNAVVHKFVEAIKQPDFVIVERTMVVDGKCQSCYFVFNGGKIEDIPNQKVIFWDETKQQYWVNGIWNSASKEFSYRLRYISSNRAQKTFTLQPFAGAAFVDTAVLEIVKEYLLGRKDYW